MWYSKNIGQNSHINYYYYDDSGNRIRRKIYGAANEFQLRDNKGRELAVYDMNTGRVKYYNLFGNGSLGRAEANWDSIWVEDPRSQNPGYWSYSRTDSRYYYIKDHLGSIRITIDEAGNVVNAQDYYSFGGILRSYETGGLSGERYKFTGKERDTETSYDYFGARYYDSGLGRWLTPDPMADKYPGWSPYNYCLNNPLKNIDIDGKEPYGITQKDQVKLNHMVKQLNTTSLGRKLVKAVYNISYKFPVSFDGPNINATNRKYLDGQVQSKFTVNKKTGEVKGTITMIVFDESKRGYNEVGTGAHEFTHVKELIKTRKNFIIMKKKMIMLNQN